MAHILECSCREHWVSPFWDYGFLPPSVYIDPRFFKWFGVVGLAFPVFLFGTLFLWIIGLLFVPRKTWLLGLIGLGVCAQHIYT